MSGKIKPKKLFYRNRPYYDNPELLALVLKYLPIKDNPKQKILVGPYYIDVTKQVYQLLKKDKIKRKRKFAYGLSGKAGNTFFVLNE